VYAALTGATFLLPVMLQVVWGYSPLASGLALLPLTVIMLALSARSGQLATRIGPRLQMSVGPVVVGVGLGMLTLATSGPNYALYVLPAVIVFGLGLAATVAPLTATAMSSAPAQHSGIASAINNDVARFGGLLAVAVLPALAASVPRCSFLERRASRAASSPRSRSPTRRESPGRPARPRPKSASTAASTLRRSRPPSASQPVPNSLGMPAGAAGRVRGSTRPYCTDLRRFGSLDRTRVQEGGDGFG